MTQHTPSSSAMSAKTSAKTSAAALRRAAIVPAVLLLAFFFAHVEIQIEGAAGWATALPTWRIEHHWLLDLFWGSRAMTGYHAWVFSFMFMMFHFPLVASAEFDWQAEARILGSIMLFWIVEDFLWFALNPAFGLARFGAATVPWHKHWLWHAPIEYWVFLPLAALLFWFGLRRQAVVQHRSDARKRQTEAA